MEHIAVQLQIDPLELRVKNFLQNGDKLFFDGPGATFQGENPLPEIVDKYICLKTD